MQALLTPKFQVGTAVDVYLKTQSALAQAVDPGTIKLSSKLLSLSFRHQHLVILHELAHLYQLANPGNDPVPSLEDEAWEAAHAWSEGRSYSVCGKARRPLNATAIIQGGSKGHPFAPIWYSKNPVEPIGAKASITVESTVIHDAITLETILDQMIVSKGESEFVIVSHGDGNGLALALQKGSTAGAERDVIFPLAADQPGEEASFDGTKMKTPAISDANLAILTRLTEPQVAALRAKMNRVRAMKLKHIAFRACNMGINKDTMAAFRKFFGAASVSAPKDFDSYGTFGPAIVPNVENYANHLRKKNYHFSIDDQVACGTRDTDSALVYQIIVAGISKKAMAAWIKKHILDDGWGPRGVFYHSVKVVRPTSPTSPSVYFVRDPEFIAGLVNYAG